LRPFIREDVINAVLAMQDIRRFRLKVTPANDALLQENAISLSEGFDAAQTFGAGRYVDLTLASEPVDQGFTDRVKQWVRGLRDSGLDPTTVLEAAQFYGRTADHGLDELDLLRDRVVIVQQIRRENPRHRTLDTDSAYAAIEETHENLAGELAAGGTLKVEAP
jgi:hypothetical protein